MNASLANALVIVRHPAPSADPTAAPPKTRELMPGSLPVPG